MQRRDAVSGRDLTKTTSTINEARPGHVTCFKSIRL